MLQEHADEAGEIVKKMLANMQEGRREEMKAQFLTCLRDAVSNYSYSVYPEVDSAYSIEGDEVHLTFLDCDLLRDEKSYFVKIVQARPKEIVARIDVELRVHAQASSSLSVYDAIDKDYMRNGVCGCGDRGDVRRRGLGHFQR